MAVKSVRWQLLSCFVRCKPPKIASIRSATWWVMEAINIDRAMYNSFERLSNNRHTTIMLCFCSDMAIFAGLEWVAHRKLGVNFTRHLWCSVFVDGQSWPKRSCLRYIPKRKTAQIKPSAFYCGLLSSFQRSPRVSQFSASCNFGLLEGSF